MSAFVDSRVHVSVSVKRCTECGKWITRDERYLSFAVGRKFYPIDLRCACTVRDPGGRLKYDCQAVRQLEPPPRVQA